MNAESSLLELSEIFVNENKKTLEEIKQQLEQLVLNNALDSSSLELIAELKMTLDQNYDIYDSSIWNKHINKINIILSKLQSRNTKLSPEIIDELNKLTAFLDEFIIKIPLILEEFSNIVNNLDSNTRNIDDLFILIQSLLTNLETLLIFLEKKGKILSINILNGTQKLVEYFLNLILPLETDEKTAKTIDDIEIAIKKITRLIFAILGIITYLKQKKEKIEPPKPTNSFREFVKRLDLTPEEQLEKNKPAMAFLEKLMKETQEMSEEESKEREQFFEDFKKNIDAERPDGFKLYS